MAESNDDMLKRVQDYRTLVLRYEQLDEEIDAMLEAHGGGTEQMSEEDRLRYRDMARERDDLQNEIRVLGQQLTLDEDA
jgi:hypothetical protein